MTTSKQAVAIIFGGQSCEHAVSVNSACSLLNHIDRERFHIEPIYIDHEGQWWQYPQQAKYQASDFASSTTANAQRCIMMADEAYQLVKLPSLEKIACDVCFSIIHGTTGEDGKLQGLFEVANIAYVGSDVAGSAVAMNKVIMKDILKANNIATADYVIVTEYAWQREQNQLIEQIKNLKLPLFVKPANTGSSVGISKVDELSELEDAIELALKFDTQVLVEEGISPARELEMAVLGNEELAVSCIGEINPPDDFYDYASKYLNATAELHYPAQVDEQTAETMQEMACKTYRVLGLRGLTRVDFLLDQTTNQPYILEVNTLPGFTNISMYPKLWDVSGKPYQQLISELIDLAIQVHEHKQQRQTDFSQELAKLQKQ